MQLFREQRQQLRNLVSQETLAKHRPASVHNRQIRASRVTIERDAQRDAPFGTHTERSWRRAPRPSGHSTLLFSILSLVRFSIASPRSPLPQSAAIETVIRIVGIDDLLDGRYLVGAV